jgi:hypothetical protein
MINEDSARNICEAENFKGFELQACMIDSQIVATQAIFAGAAMFGGTALFFILDQISNNCSISKRMESNTKNKNKNSEEYDEE